MTTGDERFAARSGGASAPVDPAPAPDAPTTSTDAALTWHGRQFKPRRLAGFDYIGRHAYHLVAVASDRRPALVGEVADSVIDDLRSAGDATRFDLLAFVVMPDHVHLLVMGVADDANAVTFMQRFKQLTGFRFKKSHGFALWQHSFFDRVLRRDEDLLAVARYILGNPVRAGLVDSVDEWRYRGGTLFAGAEAPPLRRQEVAAAPQQPAGSHEAHHA
jgi:REP element-mobilizing transposase RayT